MSNTACSATNLVAEPLNVLKVLVYVDRDRVEGYLFLLSLTHLVVNSSSRGPGLTIINISGILVN